MAKRYELTEEQFERIRDILPGKASDPGRTAQDNHRFLNAVMWDPEADILYASRMGSGTFRRRLGK